MLDAFKQASVTHGGDLWRAMQQYGGTPATWLDLSTGINPRTYPVPPLPEHIWRCLPTDHDGLDDIARQYYGLSQSAPILAVPGSQFAIRQLPALLPAGTVGLAELSYGEYAPAFRRAGHDVVRYRYPRVAHDMAHDVACNGADNADAAVFTLHPDQALPDALRYLVVVNPNNPTTHRYTTESLLKWRDILHARGGMLIVDEAFADVEPSSSVLHALSKPAAPPSPAAMDAIDVLHRLGTGLHDETGNRHAVAPHQDRHAYRGLIVLRSVGKFFGLAGIRAGFVIGPAEVLETLARHMGAWAVSGPARHAMRHALADSTWQTAMRIHLHMQRAAMITMLAKHQLQPCATPLFVWLAHPRAPELQHHFAHHRIWTRLFDSNAASGGHPSLRLGIPAEIADIDRVDKALQMTALKALTAMK